MRKSRRVKSKYIILTLVALVFGYMVAFSYHLTQSETEQLKITSSQFERDMALRNQVIEQEKTNQELQKELNSKQQKVLDFEKELSNEAQIYFNLAEDAEKYRMYLGEIKVKGDGVQVTLADADYSPAGENVNNYIVHERHVFQVINELKISGASAIAVNGQRLSHRSYILCNGPVIEVDGYQHPAPFVITAIGDVDTLFSALNLKGGVKDILVNENVQFTLEKKEEIVLDAVLSS
jgi:uncharacterized protein YlxW (UPF0749 family)